MSIMYPGYFPAQGVRAMPGDNHDVSSTILCSFQGMLVSHHPRFFILAEKNE